MAIRRAGQFLYDANVLGVPGLGIESEQLDSCVAEILRRGLKGIFGSRALGLTGDNLEFLGRLPEITHLRLSDVDLRDIEGIYRLENLQALALHPVRPAIDFSRLPSLKRIEWFYQSGDKGMSDLRCVHALGMWHFNPKSKSFQGLALPGSLSELSINWANPRSLDGLPHLAGLRRLEIHRSKNLEDLKLLPSLFPALESLVIDTCGRVDPDQVRPLAAAITTLRHAYVQRSNVLSSAQG